MSRISSLAPRNLAYLSLTAIICSPLSGFTPQAGESLREAHQWLTEEARKQVNGCRVIARDGTTLFTPDGSGNYKGMWVRDFCYMVEGAPELFKPEEIRAAYLFLLARQRSEDGAMPDRVRQDGVPIYSPGPDDKPLRPLPSTDNPQFMVKIAYHYVVLTGDMGLFRQTESKLTRGLNSLPRSSRGLVYIDPENPRSPYGFTDTVAKTGEEFFSSLLDWQASTQMAELCRRIGRTEKAEWEERAQRTKSALQTFWDSDAGMFMAAGIDCNQIDIWGSAYAVHIGVASDTQRKAIGNYLKVHYQGLVESGQLRHTAPGTFWEKMLTEVSPGTYQNGAYWGTPAGWLIEALHVVDPGLARKTFLDLVNYYRKYGVYECVNGDYRKLKNYVASATLPLAALRKIYSELAQRKR